MPGVVLLRLAGGRGSGTILCMNRILSLALVVLLISSALFAANKKVTDSREENRLRASGEVLQEILGIPDNIPTDLLNKTECVVVIPGTKKFAIGLGGSFGRGAMSCRGGANYTGPWSSPALFALEGANLGFQLGGQETDFVLLVVNPKGVDSLLRSKVKLGADAAAAAGPKGRDAAAATDVLMRAEILTYSRSRGLFAGISLEGSTLRQDNSANKKLYGRKLTARDIISGKVGVPPAGQTMVATLRQYSPRNLSDSKSLKEKRPNR
jgi:SH3 domain-containing YSC84-like protein 1